MVEFWGRNHRESEGAAVSLVQTGRHGWNEEHTGWQCTWGFPRSVVLGRCLHTWSYPAGRAVWGPFWTLCVGKATVGRLLRWNDGSLFVWTCTPRNTSIIYTGCSTCLLHMAQCKTGTTAIYSFTWYNLGDLGNGAKWQGALQRREGEDDTKTSHDTTPRTFHSCEHREKLMS